MINLTWKFSFWVFERCSLLIWLSILLVLYIYFNWGKSFCGQNLSKKQEWSLRLKRFQAKCWNLEAVTYFYSILCVFLCPFYLLCVCVCVCVCLRPFYPLCVLTSIHREGFICREQLECLRADQGCCVEDVSFVCQVPSSLL